MGRSWTNDDDPTDLSEFLDTLMEEDFYADVDLGDENDAKQFDETEFRDRVIQDLIASVQEFLSFSTREELDELIDRYTGDE